ncbi:MAG: hypothetical protein ACI9O4_001157 [Chitinophagales bacterium]|jgi:hypothetical protein
MKNHVQKIQSVLLIMAIALSLNSCSYTKNTGSASSFGKKHYNRGMVKHKSPKQDNTPILTQTVEVEKLSKKEKKEEVKAQIEQYIVSKDLTASGSDAPVEYSKENMIEKIKGNFTEAKTQLTSMKEETTSSKEQAKLDKKIKRMEKFETMLAKMSLKMEDKLTPDPDAINAPPSGRGLMGLLAGIFGIVGFAFAFAPILGYLGILLCISAIVLGVLGLSGENSAWALAGIILGALGVLMFFLAAIVIFSIF